MTLKHKMLFAIGFTFAGLVLVLYLMVGLMVLDRFQDLEDTQATETTTRVLLALDNTLEQLQMTTSDWAAWDASCRFIEGRDNGYIDEALPDANFANLKLALAVYLKPDGRLFYAKAFDPSQAKALPVADDLREYLGVDSPLVQLPTEHSFHRGILNLPRGPMLVAAHPIVGSGYQGPIQGILLLGQLLDAECLGQLKKMTGVELTLEPLTRRPGLPAHRFADTTCSIELKRLSSEIIEGRATLQDVFGRPVLQLRVSIPRIISTHGRKLAFNFMLLLLLVGLVFTLIVTVVLRKMLLNRLERLSVQLHRIGTRGDPSLRIKPEGHDEVTEVVHTINQMLQSLTNAQEDLRQANESLEKRVSTRTAELGLTNATLHREIAERLRAEEALCLSDRRKDEFLAMLAHELRNPLAPIRTAAHILNLGAADQAGPEGHLLEMIDRQVALMARLLDDLLDVSRITQGKIKLQLEQLDLCHILDNVIEAMEGVVHERGHELNYQRPPSPIWILGDPIRLDQVFSNLLQNAIKYTEGHGTIRLVVETENNGCHQATVRIQDDGIGIEPSMLPFIFDLFVQADRSLDRTRGGLGIGLTLVNHLILLHQGAVEGRSEGLGRGSEFIVHLPLLAAVGELESAPPPAQPAVVEAPLQYADGRTVLVVDDNPDTASSMAELLEIWGHQVRVAYDGPMALEIAIVFRPELVLLDIGLPGMSGFEVARCLRQASVLSGTHLIALTGYSQDEDRRQGRESGIDYYCTKPVNLEELRRVLESLGKGTPAESEAGPQTGTAHAKAWVEAVDPAYGNPANIP